MESLLRTDFTAYYGLPSSSEPNLVNAVSFPYFEIDDALAYGISINPAPGTGIARFSNPQSLTCTIANYERFISSLPSHFNCNKKRCDFLLVTGSHFILGELKDRDISAHNKRRLVRKGAKEQLLNSLETLLAVPQVGVLVSNKKTKRCCYFNKQSVSPAGITATVAFNRLSSAFAGGFKMSFPQIETLNFEYWEFQGLQRLELE
jgi:hypothetical protein